MKGLARLAACVTALGLGSGISAACVEESCAGAVEDLSHGTFEVVDSSDFTQFEGALVEVTPDQLIMDFIADDGSVWQVTYDVTPR